MSDSVTGLYEHIKLGQDKGTLVGKEDMTVPCSNADIELSAKSDYLEGPWLEKIGDTYCLFFAEIFRDEKDTAFFGYRTSVAYADSMKGPWKRIRAAKCFSAGTWRCLTDRTGANGSPAGGRKTAAPAAGSASSRWSDVGCQSLPSLV